MTTFETFDYSDEWWYPSLLPPPKPGDACVRPYLRLGSQLWWSCHWLSNGIGGIGYGYRLHEALKSVGRYLTDMRRIFPEYEL